MVKIALQIKANLENVTELTPDGEDFRWYLKFRCTNCGEESDKWIYLSQDVTVPMKGSRGQANLVTKCKMCSRDSSLDILPDTISKYTIEDSNKFKSIVTFDCRGISIIDFSPRNGFKCIGIETNTKFEDINLEEKEWVDYDERQNQPVGIYDVQHQFVTTK
ncbi:CXXC motif containing zinc binding protein isoform X1 [Rhopalosiphum padi]|uniref:CXXC motif containing zinc binding protein isoform X1 n=1 Tax=Rhopalosiphum padi TaxID=40932 RepID=UPI00298D83D8|nr:CXXC motif containing zinc binding protein isoform X1 [Rhopalosiphum padi]XP_060842767.1 CXXC motif containing zinc binding protein isoform X1 [Rhopalosiphum padi]